MVDETAELSRFRSGVDAVFPVLECEIVHVAADGRIQLVLVFSEGRWIVFNDMGEKIDGMTPIVKTTFDWLMEQMINGKTMYKTSNWCND